MDDTRRLFGAQIVSATISLVTTVVVARYVGAEAFGFCASMILIASVVLDVFDFGTCSWASRELAANKLSPVQYLKIMQRKLRFTLSLILLTPILLYIVPQTYSMSFLFVFYPVLWLQTNYVQNYLIVRSRISSAIALQLIERSTWLLYIPASFFSVEKITSYVLPILLGLAIHGFFGMMIIFNDVKKIHIDKDTDSIIMKSGYKTTKNFGTVSIVSDIGNLDGVLVAQLSSLAEAGNYNLAVRFRNPSLMSFQAFATRMRPIAATRKKSEIKKLFKDNFRFNLAGVLSILLIAILCLFSNDIIFGDSFVAVNIILAITVLSAIPTGISVICGSFLNSVGSDSFVAKSTIIYTVTGLMGTGISAFYSGSLGAVLFNICHASIICGVFVSKSRAEYQRL